MNRYSFIFINNGSLYQISMEVDLTFLFLLLLQNFDADIEIDNYPLFVKLSE